MTVPSDIVTRPTEAATALKPCLLLNTNSLNLSQTFTVCLGAAMALKLLSAAVLLLATAVSTRASDCYAIETDMKVCSDKFALLLAPLSACCTKLLRSTGWIITFIPRSTRTGPTFPPRFFWLQYMIPQGVFGTFGGCVKGA